MFLVFFYKIKIQNINVSILILLDSILLLKGNMTLYTIDLKCFNPYSIGFYSFIKNKYVRVYENKIVSILILLDSLLL